jgi:hypothetical protein
MRVNRGNAALLSISAGVGVASTAAVDFGHAASRNHQAILVAVGAVLTERALHKPTADVATQSLSQRSSAR